MSQSATSTGQVKPSDTYGMFNNISFLVRQAMAKMQTATLVQIMACTNDGDLSPVGFVDVQPLVNQIDGANPPNSTPHATVYGLPYLRMQGGTNAVVMDPQVGDIGLAVFASRDISKVKSTKAQANPGSYRSYDFADGIYVGGLLNGTPVQYVLFADAGITVVSPTAITLQAPTINIEGDLNVTEGNVTIAGTMAATGDVTAAGISVQTHTHTSEAVGSPTSPPIP